MADGKCSVFGCKTPTKPMKNGGFFETCWEHSQAKKQQEMPEQSAQEKEAAIFTVFKDFLKLLQAEYPKMDSADGITTALALTDQYWKNERTPR